MSSILVINTGSTSIKFKLYSVAGRRGCDLALSKEGLFENVSDFTSTIRSLLRQLGNLHDLSAIAHRVVHGGRNFTDTALVTEKVLSEIKRVSHLAPLHNPYNLAGIETFANYLPDIRQVAVFDTSFYGTLPDAARLYPIPQELAEEYYFYRFGFHGISHEYAMLEAAKELQKDPKKSNFITCHLGGGWSVTAIKKGKAVDTSMGFTPMEGLMMLTRSGDIDPGIVIELFKACLEDEGSRSENKHQKAMENLKRILNSESGIKGISGVGDYKELLRLLALKNPNAKQAFDLAIYRLGKFISAYYGVLEGDIDAVVFTGKIGAGDPITRTTVINNLKYLKNVPILAIEPNEELMIAKKAIELLNN